MHIIKGTTTVSAQPRRYGGVFGGLAELNYEAL